MTHNLYHIVESFGSNLVLLSHGLVCNNGRSISLGGIMLENLGEPQVSLFGVSKLFSCLVIPLIKYDKFLFVPVLGFFLFRPHPVFKFKGKRNT